MSKWRDNEMRYEKVISTGNLARKLRRAGYATWRSEDNQLWVGIDSSAQTPIEVCVTDLGWVYVDAHDISAGDPRVIRMLNIIAAELVRLGIETPEEQAA